MSNDRLGCRIFEMHSEDDTILVANMHRSLRDLHYLLRRDFAASLSVRFQASLHFSLVDSLRTGAI